VTPDNFAPFGLAAALCLFSLGRGLETDNAAFARRWFVAAGLSAGLAHLARSDGLLLVGIGGLVGLVRAANHKSQSTDRRSQIVQLAIRYLLFAICYLLVMGPWFVRNIQAIGRPLSVAGMRTLWLTDYDDLYSFDMTLSLSTFLDWGWGNIVQSKLQGLWLNLQTLFFVDWMVALAPFGLLGIWRLRQRVFFWPAWLYGLGLYLVMSLGFTLPGVRGAMLHSSVTLLPFLFAATMYGLDGMVAWVAARRRTWRARQARVVFSAGLVGIVVGLSLFLYVQKLPSYRGDHVYETIADWMAETIAPDERVLVNDPAAFYYHSQRECLAVPNGGIEVLTAVAERYDARYLILDKNVPSPLRGLYKQPDGDGRFQLVRRFRDREGDTVNVYRVGLPGD
jgi:hypothetical protein